MKINKTLLLAVFVVMAIAQWLIPVNMITHQNDVLNTGKLFKFKTAPVDPYDAFRGKYINLNFEQNFIKTKNYKKFNSKDEVYITLIDSVGYAKINEISKAKPKNGHFIKTKVNYIENFDINNNKNNPRIYVELPFNRFYMNEYDAQNAETVYAESSANEKYKTYALVAIKNGDAALKDVMINDVSIKEYVKKMKK